MIKKIYKRPSRVNFDGYEDKDIWLIQSKRCGNYYKSKINSGLNHFVSDINEATRLKTRSAQTFLTGLKNPDIYNLILIRR